MVSGDQGGEEGGGEAPGSAFRRLQQLQTITDAALGHLRFETLSRELLTRLTEVLSTDTAAVLLIDEGADELVARAAKGLEEEVEAGTRIPIGGGFAGRIAATARPLAILDVEHADVLNPILRERGVRSLLGVPLLVEGSVIGVLHVGSLTRREFSESEVELLQLAAERIAMAIEHARLYESELQARARAERALEQLARLEAVTESAFAQLGLTDLINLLLMRLRDLLAADSASIFLLDAERGDLLLRARLGPEGIELDPGVRVGVGEGFAGRVAAEEGPLVVEELAGGEPEAERLGGTGIKSLVGVPLFIEGSLRGVLTLGAQAPRRFKSDDIDVLQRAADRVAVAIEHARLYEAERQARAAAEQATARLQQVESMTEVALTHIALDDELMNLLLDRVRALLSADTASVLLLEEDTGVLVPRAARGLEEEVETRVEIPVGEGFAGRVAAQSKPFVVRDIDEFPVANPILREKHIKSMAGVPLVVEGRVVGVLHVGTLVRREFGDDDISLLALLGERIALTLGHARLYQRERRVAEALQRSMLLERLPEISGLELAARYLPGAAEADVGGDWYDVIELRGGDVAFAIGDVVSRGLRAASAMGQIRNAARAYALDGDAPAHVLDRLERVVRNLPARDMATFLYLVLDPDGLDYTYANAGHPPPLKVAADGNPVFVEAVASPPLGAVPEPSHQEARGVLRPGEALLLYTDGLVEDRDMWLSEGLERLAAAAREAGIVGDPDKFCDRLIGELLGDKGRADDVALLLIKAVVRAAERLKLRLPAEAEALATLRRRLRGWLEDAGVGDEPAYDLLVAVSEASANAVEHAYGPSDATFEVDASIGAGEVAVVIRDHGRWRPPRGRNRGRGTLLMQELMDHFEVSSGDDGTVVRLRRALVREAAA